MPWTAGAIIELLEREPKAVERGVVRILQWRVDTDQQLPQNDVGKSHWSDSNLFVSFSERILVEKEKGTPAGERLTPKQTELARVRLRKFAQVLADMANAPKPVRESKQVQAKQAGTQPILQPAPRKKRSEAWKDVRVTMEPLEPSEV